MGERMAELTPAEQKVLAALEELGATAADKLKDADQVQKKCGLPKSVVTQALMSLATKGLVKRIVREKSAGYYAVKK